MCRLGNRCFIADDQLAALYIQSRSALKGQAVPIHHERNGFVDRLVNGKSLDEETREKIKAARCDFSETRNIQVVEPDRHNNECNK